MKTHIYGQARIPDWMAGYIVGVMMVEHGISSSSARTFPCFILKKELESELPHFVGLLKEEELLFISEEIPERFRLPVLHHELDEVYRFCGQEGRCLRAFEAEMLYVPKSDTTYLPFRREFFENLVALYSKPGLHPDTEFLREIIATRDHLQEICFGIPSQ